MLLMHCKMQKIDKGTSLQAGIFYGGLIGIIKCFYLICRLKDKKRPIGAFDALAVVTPLLNYSSSSVNSAVHRIVTGILMIFTI